MYDVHDIILAAVSLDSGRRHDGGTERRSGRPDGRLFGRIRAHSESWKHRRASRSVSYFRIGGWLTARSTEQGGRTVHRSTGRYNFLFQVIIIIVVHVVAVG